MPVVRDFSKDNCCNQLLCAIITGVQFGLYLVVVLHTPQICDKNDIYYNMQISSIINIIIHVAICFTTICCTIKNECSQICFRFISIFVLLPVICYNIYVIVLLNDNYDVVLLRYDSCEDKYPGLTPYDVKMLFKLLIGSTTYYGIILISLIVMLIEMHYEDKKKMLLRTLEI